MNNPNTNPVNPLCTIASTSPSYSTPPSSSSSSNLSPSRSLIHSPADRNEKFGANLLDLQVHKTGRRSSCSSLPGIKESKSEEQDATNNHDDQHKSGGNHLGLWARSARSQNDRSRSFCLPGDFKLINPTPYLDQHRVTAPLECSDIRERVEPTDEELSELDLDRISLKREDSKKVQSSRTWPQSAIRSAAAINESLLEGLDKDSTYCESLSSIPQINVSQEDN